MIKQRPSEIQLTNNKGSKTSDFSEEKSENLMLERMKKFRDQVSKLNYEQSLSELDSVLSNLQSDSVPLDEIQEYYLQGNIYLEHCEKLLAKVEQKVVELDPENLQEKS